MGGHAIDKVRVPLPARPSRLPSTVMRCYSAPSAVRNGKDWTIAFAPSGPCSVCVNNRGSMRIASGETVSMLADASTLRRDVIEGIDMLVIRELTGGIYFGKPKGIEKMPGGGERGINTEVYTTEEIRRIAVVAFTRRLASVARRVMSVDKANASWSRRAVATGGDRWFKRLPDVTFEPYLRRQLCDAVGAESAAVRCAALQ